MFDLFWVPNFIKIGYIAIWRPNLAIILISGQDLQFQISFMSNKLDLLWLPNFIALGLYFIFGTKFSWNEGIDTCFKSTLSGLRQYLANKSSLKMMKNAFYFTFKAVFILKIFTFFLSWHFGHVEKQPH